MAFVRFHLRADTGANWTANNPPLGVGEVGFELPGVNLPPTKFKVGPGLWNDLPYISGGGGTSTGVVDLTWSASTHSMLNSTGGKGATIPLATGLVHGLLQSKHFTMLSDWETNPPGSGGSSSGVFATESVPLNHTFFVSTNLERGKDYTLTDQSGTVTNTASSQYAHIQVRGRRADRLFYLWTDLGVNVGGRQYIAWQTQAGWSGWQPLPNAADLAGKVGISGTPATGSVAVFNSASTVRGEAAVDFTPNPNSTQGYDANSAPVTRTAPQQHSWLDSGRLALEITAAGGDFAITIQPHHVGVFINLQGNSNITGISGLKHLESKPLEILNAGGFTISESSLSVSDFGESDLTINSAANGRSLLAIYRSRNGNYYIANTGRRP